MGDEIRTTENNSEEVATEETAVEETAEQTPDGKSYTQEQLNIMLANEKRTARQAILKELGFEVSNPKDYKATVKGIKATLDAGKTQAQLDAEARKTAETAKAEAEAKASMLEMKVAALAAGVNPQYLDDVIILAQAKVNDTTTVDKVITELKNKYSTFFEEGSTVSGTGRSNNPPRKPATKTEGLGQRLAKANRPVNKSTYFKN
nr:MAG TPA: Major capsid protein [Caudoviricetes sp.]